MELSVSDLKLWMTCPQMFDYQWRHRRVPATKGVALELGTIVHAHLEAKLLGKDYTPTFPDAAVEEAYDALRPVIEAWEKPEGWKVLHTELEVHHLGLVGRVDYVVEWNGSLWIGQHKTLSATVPLDVYAEQVRTDWHECFYHAAVESFAGRRVTGTILNVIRKLSGKQLSERGAKAGVSIHYLARSREEMLRGLTDIQALRDGIVGNTLPVIQNRSACAGPYRNSLCAYKSVCDSGNLALLGGEGFKDTEDRYGKTETD